jgi:hypothetical protein
MGITQRDVPPEIWAKLNAAAFPRTAESAKRKPMELVAPAFEAPGTWTIPVHVVAGDNARGMRSKIGRAGHERNAVFHVLARYHREFAPLAEAAQAGRPLVCVLTRIGRLMDSDGLAGACKYVRDAIAAFLGVSDGPLGPVRWEYEQESHGSLCGVRITIESPTGDDAAPRPS